MKFWILTAAAALALMGCSKEGSKSRLLDGGAVQEIAADPTPTDTNFPELGPTSTDNLH